MQGFMAVARLGSFSRAASELGLSQSALSQSVQQLEFLLDAELLDRRNRTIVATPAGAVLMRRLRGILDDLDGALNEVQREINTNEGAISVACLSTVATLLMPPTVGVFKQQFPKVSVSIRDENVDGILDQVKSGAVDFAVTCLFSDDREIAFEPVLRDRFRFVCTQDHPFATRKFIRWRDLDQANLVVMTRGTGIRRLIDRHLSDASVLDKAKYEVSRVPSILKIVEEGGVSSVLPALTLAALPTETQLVHLPMTEPEIQREVGIATRTGVPLQTIAERFRRDFLHVLVNGHHLAHMPDIHILADP
ncbi:LysR family transcriptional regulator [Rhodovulum iodosum]|nr:LysR family transcriptional regulator [Rhodovulum robiginosum]RSK32160.1 LysR family transcriptional regulator [Rhodovulum robiginosum]